VRGVIVVAMLVFLWMVWRLVDPLSGRWMAVAVIVVSLAVFSSSHLLDGIMSDVPFCAAVWCVVMAADDDGPLSRRRLLAMAIAGAMAFTFRMAALALFPAIALMALLRPRREWPGLALVALVWLLAAAFVMFGLPTSSALAAETARDASALLKDFTQNIRYIGRAVFETFLYPFASNVANDVLHWVMSLVAIAGAWRLLRIAPRRSAWLFAGSYIFMLLILPTRSSRYWLPLVPLQMLALLEGVAWLTRSVRVIPRWTPAAVAALLVLVGMRQGSHEPPTPFAKREEVTAIVEAIRQASPGQRPRVSFFSPRLLTWHTGFPAMGHFAASPDQVLAELREKRIDYLVTGTLGEQVIPDEDAINRAIVERADGYEKLGTFGGFTLFRVLP
jgi:NADH:ubiquinone oxidoreductase subunit 6 (subunit J)